MFQELQTVEQVIEKLGGAKAVAELASCTSPSVVPMWKVRQKFPPKTYTVIKSALHQRGLSAPNKLWGMR